MAKELPSGTGSGVGAGGVVGGTVGGTVGTVEGVVGATLGCVGAVEGSVLSKLGVVAPVVGRDVATKEDGVLLGDICMTASVEPLCIVIVQPTSSDTTSSQLVSRANNFLFFIKFLFLLFSRSL